MTQPPRRKIILILSLCVFLFIIKSTGQIVDFSYTHYGKEDGLPSNTVYCMTADKDGVLWIGTDAGLTRFDGSHYKTFTTKDGLPSNDIFNLYCDSKNRVWVVGMSKDVAYFKNGKLYNRGNDTILNKINRSSGIIPLFEDSKNSLWIINQNKMLTKIDSNNKLEAIDLSEKFKDFKVIISKISFKDSLYAFYNDMVIVGSDLNFRCYPINEKTKIFVNGFQVINDTCYYSTIDGNFIFKSNSSILNSHRIATGVASWRLYKK